MVLHTGERGVEAMPSSGVLPTPLLYEYVATTPPQSSLPSDSASRLVEHLNEPPVINCHGLRERYFTLGVFED